MSGEDVDNFIEFYEEEKLYLINVDIMFFWKRKNIVEKVVCGLNRVLEDIIKVIDDIFLLVEYMKIIDKEFFIWIVKYIIM